MRGVRPLVLCLALINTIVSCKQFSSDAPVEDAMPEDETELPVSEPDPVVPAETSAIWAPYDDSREVAANADHPNPRMRYKLIQSRVLDKNEIFRPLYDEVQKMSPNAYERLKPLILDRSIPEVQEHILAGRFGYEDLCRFFLYRIYKYELDNSTTLNTIIALNPDIFSEARKRDSILRSDPEGQRHPIFGMPVLLKDNINTEEMPTTAGAVALMGNRTGDAFIVERLKEKGALILGKVNLSEWAYYFCDLDTCPSGYSAVGGQTLNPYGRRVFESGGSSSGSGTAMAAGYAMAAVGTETSGSILSPSGKNSIVGLKPNVGMLSRTGIVPISSTLDTPGPMTRNVTDNGILLDAMMGHDITDEAAFNVSWEEGWYFPENTTLRGRRLGVFQSLMESDSLYRETVEKLRSAGAEIFEIAPKETELSRELDILLNYDMKRDLPQYLRSQLQDTLVVQIRSVADVVAFNRNDPETRMPYGQAQFEQIAGDTTSDDSYARVRRYLTNTGREFFGAPWKEYDLDAILSVDNKYSGFAAVAKYPVISVPLGYRENGEPTGLTFIGKGFQIPDLLRIALAYEQLNPVRIAPEGYAD